MNTFSAEKIFFHAERFINYINTGNIVTPSSVDIDISGVCNHSCFFCNGLYTHNNKFMSLSKVKNIMDICKELNCHSACLAGGGEPTLNPNFSSILDLLVEDFDILITTNGSRLYKLYNSIHDVNSIGISFEAINHETYYNIRKSDDFEKVKDGIEKLNSIKKQNNIKDTTLKTLITKYNINQIYDICKWAKDIGMDNIYIRPAGLFKWYDKQGNIRDLSSYYLTSQEIKIINSQIEKCLSLSCDTFNVYFSNASHNSDYNTPIYEFNRCLACMVSLSFCSDDGVYICVDHKHEKEWKLCDIPDTLKYFNSEFHRNLIKNINISQCPRCSKNKVNKLIQDFFIQDSINRNFI